MPRKKIIVPPIVVEKKPKIKYVSPIKDYTVSYEATIKIVQNGLQSTIPHNIKADKKNFIQKNSEEVLAKLNKLIEQAILDKCSFCTKVIAIDNIKFDQNLIKED